MAAGTDCYAVWLADFPANTRLRVNAAVSRCKDLFLDREIKLHRGLSSELERFSRDYPTGSHLAALVALEPSAQHHALLPLTECEETQRQAWRQLIQTDLHGKMFYFRVVALEPLRLPVPIELVGRQYKKRFFGSVNESWGEQFFTNNMMNLPPAQLRWWKGLLPDGHHPSVLLRLPRAILTLVLEGHWRYIAIPDLARNDLGLLAGWNCFPDANSIRLQCLRNSELPSQLFFQPATGDVVQKIPEEFSVFTSAGRKALQGVLQSASRALLGGRPGEGQTRDALLLDLLAAARAVEDAEDNHLVSSRLHLSGTFRVRYHVGSLLQYFFLAGFLRNDSVIRPVLELAVQSALPPDVSASALKFIRGDEGPGLRIPSASTISRIRFKVDVAWMLLFREQLKGMLDSGGVSIFAQTDATAQAGRQYQMIILNIVRHKDLDELFKDRRAQTSVRAVVQSAH